MYNNNALARIAEIIAKGSAGVIILAENPALDSIAAGISLYLGLTKLGKNVSLACSSSVQTDLVGADKIQLTLSTSGNNLVVSFPYSEGSIDKVDYNIQGNFFNLIITPRQSYPRLDPNQVKYSYAGGSFDFIITIDAPNLNGLGEIYSYNQALFQGKNIINIDRHLANSFFGAVNFVNKTSSSTSELVFKILKNLNCEIDKDMATSLYAGISSATNNFNSYSVNAETFEVAANLMKLGALKKSIKSPTVFQSPILPSQPAPQPVINNQPSNKPAVSFEKQTIKPIESVEKEPQQIEETTPQDWLKPKIFRGGGLI